MADYYTTFSCILDVGSAENVEKALALYRNYADELEREQDLDIGFSADPHADGAATASGIWIHDDGNGDVEHVIAFAARCGQALGLTGRWGFQYANTCSRPRLDGFGGGAHVLDLATGATVGWTDTDSWLAATIAASDPG